MNHKIIISILVISTAGLCLGYQFQHRPADDYVQLPPVAPRPITPKIANAENGPAYSNTSNLMDSSILIKAADPNLSNNQKFEILWSAYQRNKSSDLVASYYLDSLVSITPVPNAATLISELNNAMTSPELQRHLMRLLETAFRDRENNDLHGISQAEILNTIKTQMASNESSVANEAVTIYARHASSDLAIDALSNAHDRKIVGDAEFIHEMIFKIPNVDDPKKQNWLITQMINLSRNSKSPDAGNVLVDAVGFLFKYADQVKLDGQTGSELKNVLSQNEPQFYVEEGAGYDMLTAIKYCSWLNSFAKSDNKSELETLKFMVDTLTSNSIDPKKIVAVMLTDRSQEILDLARKEGKLGNLQNSLKIGLLKLPPGSEQFKLHQSVLNQLN